MSDSQCALFGNGRLPREVVSLIHHVELHKAGWWDKALEILIVASLWAEDSPPTTGEVQSRLKRAFALDVDIPTLERRIQSLQRQGVLVRLDTHRFKLSETARCQFEADTAEAERLEEDARQAFVHAVERLNLDLPLSDPWSTFHERLLLPLVCEIGARTYELISGLKQDLAPHSSYRTFINEFPPEAHSSVRKAVAAFLDPANPPIRQFVLRQLTAYFCLEACQLSESALQRVLAVTSPRFTVFLDTNALFSMLELQDNPSNEAAVALCKLVQKLPKKVHVGLYILLPTVAEAKRALAHNEELLENVRIPANHVRTYEQLASEGQIGLTGLVRGYVRRLGEAAPSTLSAEAHFRYYSDNLLTLSRAKGMEVFNEDLTAYGMKQKVIDDIMNQLEYEKGKYGGHAKDYDRLRHDMVVWHFTRDKRPLAYDSPLDARYWIATIDYRFLRFDAFKRGLTGDPIPICMHPTSLIQLLQFWVPRTPEFETAMLANMRLPFLFVDFDVSAERTTLAIIRSLGGFDNANEIPVETAVSLIVNEDLRSRVHSAADVKAQVEVVREALIEEHRKVKERESALEAQLAEQKAETEKRDRRIDDLEQRLGDLQSQVARSSERRRTQTTRFWFSLLAFLELALAAGLSFVLSFELARLVAVPFLPAMIACGSTALLIWVSLVARTGSRHEALRAFKPYALISRFRAALWAILGAALATTLGMVLYDLLKGL